MNHISSSVEPTMPSRNSVSDDISYLNLAISKKYYEVKKLEKEESPSGNIKLAGKLAIIGAIMGAAFASGRALILAIPLKIKTLGVNASVFGLTSGIFQYMWTAGGKPIGELPEATKDLQHLNNVRKSLIDAYGEQLNSPPENQKYYQEIENDPLLKTESAQSRQPTQVQKEFAKLYLKRDPLASDGMSLSR